MKRLIPILVLLAAACGAPDRTPAAVEAEGKNLRITGPYVHANLAVYLLHSDARDDRDFVTLDEGLKNKTVTVTEKEQGQVNQLLLENLGEKPLFVQEGDRVKGGKQDRIVGLSFVVPVKSGKMPIPSFCVEQGRWTSQGGLAGASFAAGDAQLAPKQVRAAAKAGKDQSEVWRQVEGVKRQGVLSLGSENTNSSLNETMDSEKTKKAVEPYEKALAGILAGRSDVVGVAFALNGKIEEVNVYPGHKLLAKLYPRLLGSYALTAVLENKSSSSPYPSAVAAFMKEGREKGNRTEKVEGNSVTVRDFEANVQCVTEYQGKSVHAHWMRRDTGSARPAGNEGQQQIQQVEEQNQAPRR